MAALQRYFTTERRPRGYGGGELGAAAGSMTGITGTDFSISVDIHAPMEKVWRVMSEVERWPEWTATVKRVVRLDGRVGAPLGIGDRFRVSQPKLLPAVWTVTTLDLGRSFTWKAGSVLVWVYATHSVQATSVEA